MENIEVPYDVISKIAAEIDTNVRDLEGVFTRVVAFASLTNKTFDLSILDESRASIDPNSLKTPVSIEDIEKAVARYFNLSINDLHRKSRECRELTPISFSAIARYFGGLNHTTVLRAYDKVKAKCEKDENFKNVIKNLIAYTKN